jgi:hypothetical protein
MKNLYTYFHLNTYNKAFNDNIDIFMLFKCFIFSNSAPTIGSAEQSSKSTGAHRYDSIDVWLTVKRQSFSYFAKSLNYEKLMHIFT